MKKLIILSLLLFAAQDALAEGIDVSCLNQCMQQGNLFPVCKRMCSF